MDNVIEDVEIKTEVATTEPEKNINYYAPQRLENESFEEYKLRRSIGNKMSKTGYQKMFWDSKTQGTYVKAQKSV